MLDELTDTQLALDAKTERWLELDEREAAYQKARDEARR